MFRFGILPSCMSLMPSYEILMILYYYIVWEFMMLYGHFNSILTLEGGRREERRGVSGLWVILKVL